jgi:multidrug efflux pump subunit AcrA (membrane-fusion protein)
MKNIPPFLKIQINYPYSIIGIFIISYGFISCGKKIEYFHPERRDLIEVVYASGNLFPASEYKVIASVTGYLDQVEVNEGDSIQPNQILFSISGPNRKYDSETAALLLEQAEADKQLNAPQLLQLKEKYAAAQLKVNNDSINWIRYIPLAKTGAIAQAELDRIALVLETDRLELKGLANQIQAQENKSKTDWLQARNRYLQSKSTNEEGIIKSILKGKVYEIYKQKGDFVHQNEPIALLGDEQDPIARLSMDEADLNKVHQGQKILITLDAWPDKQFVAVVDKIYPRLNKAEQSFWVDAKFEIAPPIGLYGLNLEANIIIKESPNALCIPRSLVLPGDSVIVKRDHDQIKVHIQKGAEDLIYTEVLSGILLTDELPLIVKP